MTGAEVGLKSKRGYALASIGIRQESFIILLDGKLAHTPKHREMSLPTRALADAVAEEFNAQVERVNPHAMPMTQMANILLDLVKTHRMELEVELSQYIETDLLCYRSEDKHLDAMQAELWDIVLSWAIDRYDVSFDITRNVMPIMQSHATVERFANVVCGLSDVQIAAAAVLVPAAGSLLLALALIEEEITPEHMIKLSQLEDDYQTSRWGEDAEKERRLQAARKDIHDAGRFLSLAQTDA